MKKVIVLIFILFCSTLSAFSAETTFLLENKKGRILITPEYIIKVMEFDTFDSLLWLPGDDLIITNRYVINPDDGTKVEIEYIRWR